MEGRPQTQQSRHGMCQAHAFTWPVQYFEASARVRSRAAVPRAVATLRTRLHPKSMLVSPTARDLLTATLPSDWHGFSDARRLETHQGSIRRQHAVGKAQAWTSRNVPYREAGERRSSACAGSPAQRAAKATDFHRDRAALPQTSTSSSLSLSTPPCLWPGPETSVRVIHHPAKQNTPRGSPRGRVLWGTKFQSLGPTLKRPRT